MYEFEHFVRVYDVTLSNSIFGSTFYVLTGTHGCHVAIGVLWLVLMYIRTFKPVDADEGRPWVLKQAIHFVVFTVSIVATMYVLLAFIHGREKDGFSLATIGASAGANFIWIRGCVRHLRIAALVCPPAGTRRFRGKERDGCRRHGPLLALRRYRLDRHLHRRLPPRIPLSMSAPASSHAPATHDHGESKFHLFVQVAMILASSPAWKS